MPAIGWQHKKTATGNRWQKQNLFMFFSSVYLTGSSSLIMEGTIEEKIQKLQAEKMSLCSEILDGHDVPLSMTAEIMEKLILE